MTPLLRWFPLALVAAASAPSCTDPCWLVSREAHALKHEYSRCQTDDQCAAYRFGSGFNNCIPGFECAQALSVREDIYEYRRQLQDLSEQYISACGHCGMAMCQGIDRAYCDENGMCALGSGPDAQMVITPTSLDFGTLFPGTFQTLTVDVASVGEDTVFIDEIRLEDLHGSEPSSFRSNIDEVDRILRPGESVTLTVTCVPEEPGIHEAELLVYSNGLHEETAIISMSCEGS